MSYEHVGVVSDLGGRLIQRLDAECFRVIIEGGRLRRSLQHSLVPDVCVVPADLFPRRRRAQPGRLAVFDESLPLVVEVWSPSTGDYDVAEKIPEYQQRGDLGIWRLHPFERTLTAWRRQEDGSYVERVFHGGVVQPVALPNVTIDLDALFDFR